MVTVHFKGLLVLLATIHATGTQSADILDNSQKSQDGDHSAKIVFFRPSGKGISAPCVIRENGKLIGAVGNKRYYEIETSPGLHSFTSPDNFSPSTQANDVLEVDALVSKTTYIRCTRTTGLLPMFGGFQLSHSNQLTFENYLPKLKPEDREKIAKRIQKELEKGD